MSGLFNNNAVFIRSMATRGSLGGLNAKIIEVTDLLQAFGFDYIIIETVGVGQSEVEIAGIADTTVVTLVPESGDEVQTIKSGIMEIADIFVVNKSDREGADAFIVNLKKLVLARHTEWHIPVIATVATKNEGIEIILKAIEKHHKSNMKNEKQSKLLIDKAWMLIMQRE